MKLCKMHQNAMLLRMPCSKHQLLELPLMDQELRETLRCCVQTLVELGDKCLGHAKPAKQGKESLGV